jgi:hypothetical protein
MELNFQFLIDWLGACYVFFFQGTAFYENILINYLKGNKCQSLIL